MVETTVRYELADAPAEAVKFHDSPAVASDFRRKAAKELSKLHRNALEGCQRWGGALTDQYFLYWTSYRLYRLWTRRGEPSRAIPFLVASESALKDPGYKQAMWCFLGDLSRTAGDYQGASGWFATCDPATGDRTLDTIYRVMMALLDLSKNDAESALELLGRRWNETSLSIDPEVDGLVRLARAAAHEKLGNDAEAAQELESITEIMDAKELGSWLGATDDPVLKPLHRIWERVKSKIALSRSTEGIQTVQVEEAPEAKRTEEGEHFLRCRGCSEEVPHGFAICPACGRRLSIVRRLVKALRTDKEQVKKAVTGFSVNDLLAIGIPTLAIFIPILISVLTIFSDEPGCGTGGGAGGAFTDAVLRQQSAEGVQLNSMTRGLMTDSQERVVYGMNLDQHATVTIAAFSEWDNYLELYQAGQSHTIHEDDDSGPDRNARLSNLHLAPGHYHVLLRPYGDGTGHFVLSIMGRFDGPVASIVVEAGENAVPILPGERWTGDYLCSQGRTDMQLEFLAVQGLRVQGIFHFNHAPSGARGSFHISGEYQPVNRGLSFQTGRWIEQPRHYTSSGLYGVINEEGTSYVGLIDNPNCGDFTVSRPR